MLSTLGKKLIRPITITVEGNIGSGKTTFLNYIAERDKNAFILAEPVAQWRNLQGYNLLKLMYTDPKKWGFPFQTYVQLTMLQMHAFNETDRPYKLMERSLHSAIRCFVENLWQSGIMEIEQKIVLDEWYKWLESKDMLKVDLIVYLRAKPETAFRRIQERGRREEMNNVSIDLLKNLHELHENWLDRKQGLVPAPVVVIDAEKSITEMLQDYDRIRDQFTTGNQMKNVVG